MHLPFTVAVELPTRDDLRQPLFWAIVVGVALALIGAVLVRSRRPPSAEVPGIPATLAIASDPAGATVLVDGKARGHTPATLALRPGARHVALRLARYAEVTYTVRLVAGQATTLAAPLWLRTPEVRQVRPPLPGATITDAQFLADGRIALTVALPPGDERQLWLLGTDGDAQRIGPPAAQTALATAPDGERVAYLARSAARAGSPTGTATDARPDEVWITGRAGERGQRRYALPTNTADERLTDVAWAPDGAHLLLVSQQRPQGGGIRTRLLWLDGAGTTAPRELIAVPSEILPGSYAWSPRGDRVAFLARANGRVTLCLLGTDGIFFRTLADVGDVGGTPTFPPLAWIGGSPGVPGGVVYAAPDPRDPAAGGGLFSTADTPALFADDLAGHPAHRLGVASGQGPGWRSDGLLVALVRPKRGGPLALRAFDPRAGGAAQDLGTLPQLTDTPEGVRWDLARGQALVTLRGSAGAGQFDLWLVRWTARAGEVAR